MTLPELLRERTHDLHREIEGVNPILSETFSREDYVRHLKALHSLFESFEDSISRFTLPWHLRLKLEQRKKAPLLRQDLIQLGHTPQTALETRKDQSDVDSLSTALGAMYVFEGSTLGGQIIYRHLRDRHHVSEGALSFFHGYGSETADMWRSFKDVLTADDLGLSADEVVRGACATFRAYIHVLKDLRQFRS